MTNDLPPAVVRFVATLKEAYSRDPPPPRSVVSSWMGEGVRHGGQYHASLALIEGEGEVPYVKMDRFTRSTLRGCEEDIMKPKRTLLMSQIGTSEDGTPPDFILLEGGRGVGKSHLSRHLALMWTEGKVFSDHTLFLHLPLQDNHLHTATFICDLLHHHPDPLTRQAVGRWMEERRGQGCLLLLDGYDDLRQQPGDQHQVSIFDRIITQQVLEEATVVVTCRPLPSPVLHLSPFPSPPSVLDHLLRQGAQAIQHIEVVGFTSPQVLSYASQALGENHTQLEDFHFYLEATPIIHSLMHVPLYCAAVVKLYLELGGVALPQTLTRLHEIIVFSSITEALGLPLPLDRGKWKIRELRGRAQDLLNWISQLAYNGSQDNCTVFFDVNEELLTLGLMEPVSMLHPNSHAHQFFHRHLQHFLSAHHLLQTSPPPRQREAIRDISATPHMREVLRYTAGLSKEAPSPLKMEFFHSVSENFLDTIHYAFEAEAVSELTEILRGSEIHFLPHPLTLVDCYVIGCCMLNNNVNWSTLYCRNCHIDERGVAMMAHPLNDSRRTCFAMVQQLDLSGNPISDCGLDPIVSALREDHNVKELLLANCLITGKGVEKLVDVLRMDQVLQTLDLSRNAIGYTGADHLATFLRQNSTLSQLFLSRCGIEEEGVIRLAEALSCRTLPLRVLDLLKDDDG